MTGGVPRDVHAILFDLDGVLIHSAPAWFRVLQRAAARFARPPIAHDVFVTTFGQGLEADRRLFFPDQQVAAIAAFYDEAFPEEIASVETGEGALPLLAAVRAAGLKQAVVTNAPRMLALRILEAKGMMPLIDAVAAAGDAPEKPAPDLVLLALERLGVAAAHALYVGDSTTDVAAARAAGVMMAGLGVAADIPLSSLADVRRLVSPTTPSP